MDVPISQEIRQARAARSRATRDKREAQAERKAMTPLWEQLTERRLVNSIGEEYEISLKPKGAA